MKRRNALRTCAGAMRLAACLCPATALGASAGPRYVYPAAGAPTPAAEIVADAPWGEERALFESPGHYSVQLVVVGPGRTRPALRARTEILYAVLSGRARFVNWHSGESVPVHDGAFYLAPAGRPQFRVENAETDRPFVMAAIFSPAYSPSIPVARRRPGKRGRARREKGKLMASLLKQPAEAPAGPGRERRRLLHGKKMRADLVRVDGRFAGETSEAARRIYVVERGSGTFLIEGRELPVAEGAIIRVPPGTPYAFQTQGAFLVLGEISLPPVVPEEPETAPRSKGRNLILISLGNVGARRMSLYGYPRKTTPRLEKWAEEALVFDTVFSHASWTLPVAVSMFTSQYPHTHRIQSRRHANALPGETRTLPEVLKAAGYRTAAFAGGLDYFPGFSHMRGFDRAPDNINFTEFKTTLAQARNWLAEDPRAPFMLFIHGYDSHCPFTPFAPFRGTFSDTGARKITVDLSRCVRGFANSKDYTAFYAGRCPSFRKRRKCEPGSKEEIILTRDDIEHLSDLYDEEVLQIDALVGGFLESLDERIVDGSIIVVTGDHGEMFAKHGRFGRAGTVRGTLYDDVLHVPLLIRFPGLGGRRVRGLVQHIDVMPTLLAALGLPAPGYMQGKDLAPLIAGGAAVNERSYAGLRYNNRAPSMLSLHGYPVPTINESLRAGRWKLIHEVFFDGTLPRKEQMRKAVSEGFELYDLEKDPDELRDLADERPTVLERMKGEMAAWVGECRTFSPFKPRTQPIPRSLIKDAAERGYWQDKPNPAPAP